MTGGSLEAEHPTDGACGECGRFYRDVGSPSPLEVHEKFCDGDGEGGPPGGDGFPENPDADDRDQEPEEIVCPECGGDLREYEDHPGMYHCPSCGEWWEED